AGIHTVTPSQSSAIGQSPLPVTSQRGPAQARAASSVSGVSPSCETTTSRSASPSGRRTSSSACTASPPDSVTPVPAAWNDVPHPLNRSRAPSGKHRSVGTCASHSGCAAMARLVCSPCTRGTSIRSGGVTVFQRDTLDNGLRVLTADLPYAQSVAVMVMLAAGSRYETAESGGIAHFSEHMFFKGTERRPSARQIAGEIDAIGGEFNAFTG